MDTYVYILRCSDGSYYVGKSRDPDRRVIEHNLGLIDGYTWHRRPVMLLWAAPFPNQRSAFAFERRIKTWTRAKKEALMRNDWDEIRRLSRGGSRLAPLRCAQDEVGVRSG